MNQYSVLFLPDNKKVKVIEGTSILEAAVEAGVGLEGPCGGKGSCGKCAVYIQDMQETKAAKKDTEKKLRKVLACQTKIYSDLAVTVPQVAVSVHRKSMINLFDFGVNLEVNPGIEKVCLQVKKPSLDHQVSDRERFLKELAVQTGTGGCRNFRQEAGPGVCLEALRALPSALRKEDHRVTAVLSKNKVIAVEPGDTTERIYGVAVDLGTTSVVASLFDLNTGKHLGTAAATNIQNIYGADVISRITYCIENEEGLEQLHGRAIQVINSLIDELCRTAGITYNYIYRITVVGNTTMTHLFTKLDPSNLAPSPFIPAVTRSMVVEARDLGLYAAPHAQIHVLPNIAGFLGSDTVGVVLATGLYRDSGIKLAIDIGTNGEIVLAKQGEMVACSTAAGPAFEGAQIKYGMRAAEGAIEKVAISQDVEIETIGGYAARGICGSGLLDAVAEMIKAGIIDVTGKIISREEAGHLPPKLQERLGNGENGRFFILATEEETSISGPVLLTQRDVRELQLAKGAIKAGIQILMTEQGITFGDLERILLAGAFGNYIKKESALTVGLLPPLPPDRIVSVGNAAGAGAQMALLSENMLKEAGRIAKVVRHVELSSRKDFQSLFINALNFK